MYLMSNTLRARIREIYGDQGPVWAWPLTFCGTLLLAVTAVGLTKGSDAAGMTAYSLETAFVVGAFGWLWWQNSLRYWFRKRLARFLVGEVFQRGHVAGPVGVRGNLCGSGGHTFRPMTKTWQEIFDQWPDHSLRTRVRKDNQRAIIEELFFGYFGPLESWCERNLSHAFYLWTDDRGVALIIPDEEDRLLWKLTWDDGLPSPTDVDSL